MSVVVRSGGTAAAPPRSAAMELVAAGAIVPYARPVRVRFYDEETGWWCVTWRGCGHP